MRQGAHQIIAQAVEAELQEFLAQYQPLQDDQGQQAIVRNGYIPERTIMTGVRAVALNRHCILVIIGVTDNGVKELLGLESGFRESALNWKLLLLRLRDQRLTTAPELAVGDGALGFWKALAQIFSTTHVYHQSH